MVIGGYNHFTNQGSAIPYSSSTLIRGHSHDLSENIVSVFIMRGFLNSHVFYSSLYFESDNHNLVTVDVPFLFLEDTVEVTKKTVSVHTYIQVFPRLVAQS